MAFPTWWRVSHLRGTALICSTLTLDGRRHLQSDWPLDVSVRIEL
jgi:hypothetical protein